MNAFQTEVLARLDRIEAALLAVVQAMAPDEDDEPGVTLDGEHLGGERDQGQSLG